jgi:hypothetical protein
MIQQQSCAALLLARVLAGSEEVVAVERAAKVPGHRCRKRNATGAMPPQPGASKGCKEAPVKARS